MRVVPPLAITTAMLNASTADEPMVGSPATESIYAAGTTYALGDQVISTATHRKYESLQAANVGHPLPVLPETTTAWWLDIGATNRWAMFDLSRSTQTETVSPLEVIITPGERISAVGVNRIEGTAISISLDSSIGSPSTNYYFHSEQLVVRNALVENWYDWFFGEFAVKTEVARFDIPPFASGVLTVAITNTGGDAKCGGLVIGTSKYLGEAQRDAQLDLVQFSVIDRDPFGEATLTPRRSIPTAEHRVLLDAERVRDVYYLLVDLDAVPALWSAADDADHVLFAPLLIFGIYRNASFKAADPDCELALKLEEI